MPEIKVSENYDPLNGVTETHYIDTDTNKFLSRFRVNMDTCLRYAHDRRQEESKGKGNRFKGVLKGGLKSIGVLPTTIFHAHPEIVGNNKEMQKLLQHRYPDLKTTNAKLC